ncbi:hypothetical protein MY04_4182 [Flammeovirga sp. MY04]|uniref:AGE family epimerase/isomerase n=1 Tax=Flammeovirga sp. MY04 TaxID=1191459 RepID=UPI0008060962|nr:AGE family epimerase/isomerase [Flammeovirga sp. MY04]ANQ51524.1 hypothetical protein MY04_4182 [Flammeovirga sp. MY04]
MKSFKYGPLLLLTILLFNCQQQPQEGSNYFRLNDQMLELISFFEKNAWDESKSTYLSEIDNEGKAMSDKIFTVASSRLIYGLSYASQSKSDYLMKAKKVANFQKEYLIGEDDQGAFSYSFVENKKVESPTHLDVWQQAYGLCGLSELYRQTKDATLLPTIHQLHNGFIGRFKDEEAKGLWGNFKIGEGGVTNSKSLQSLMYPLTAYMINLWEADKENKHLYEHQIAENVEMLYNIAWNKETQWVNVKFNDDWSVKKTSEGKYDFTVTPGHNFQLSALLLRTSKFDFLSKEKKQKYQSLGRKILDITLEKNYLFDDGNIINGFYSEVDPNTNEVLDTRKTWWQHAEAIIALSLYGGKYDQQQELLEDYFFTTFFDKQNGGEYFYVTENNTPITEELKGSIGKSTYHTIEMIRILNDF